jgi:SNF2 family DNA or RNA helicase
MRGIFTTNDGAGGSGKVQLKSLHNVLMQIRKLINHPYMLDGVEDFSTQNEFGEHLVENSPKLQFLDKLLTKVKNQ